MTMPNRPVVPDPAVRADDPPIFPTTLEVSAAKRAQAESLPPENVGAPDAGPAFLDKEPFPTASSSTAAGPEFNPARTAHPPNTVARTAVLGLIAALVIILIIAAIF